MALASKFTVDPILRWPSLKTKDWLQNFLLDAESNQNISSIVAIGSSVRKNVTSADLDLVVLVREHETKILETPPIEVDLRLYQIRDVEALVENGHDLLGWAIKFGVPLLDKNDVWHNLADNLHQKVPLPSTTIAIDRASKTKKLLDSLIAIGDTDAAHEQLLTLLTHLARSQLVRHSIFPASRPELSQQLRQVNESELANLLEQALKQLQQPNELYSELKKLPGLEIFQECPIP